MDVVTALRIYEMDEKHPLLEQALDRLLQCETMKSIKDDMQEELEGLQKDKQNFRFFPQSSSQSTYF